MSIEKGRFGSQNLEGNKKRETAVFDVEKEKERRKEIRKMLVESLSETVGKAGFKKEGYSTWQRKIDGKTQLLYLQRSQWSHEYYINLGIYDPNGRKQKGRENIVKPDITDCQIDDRIEGAIAKKMPGNSKEEIEAEAAKLKEIREVLDFEIKRDEKTTTSESSGEEYYFPSVSIEEAEEKIAKIKGVVEEYAIPWFSSK